MLINLIIIYIRSNRIAWRATNRSEPKYDSDCFDTDGELPRESIIVNHQPTGDFDRGLDRGIPPPPGHRGVDQVLGLCVVVVVREARAMVPTSAVKGSVSSKQTRDIRACTP